MRGVTFKKSYLGVFEVEIVIQVSTCHSTETPEVGAKHKNLLTLNENGSKVFLEAKEENEITFLDNPI